jgi:hypothetical protein
MRAPTPRLDRRHLNPGRAPLAPGQQSVKYTFRVTPDMRAKIDRIGGADKLRDLVERVKE